jgi:hypothetical protein
VIDLTNGILECGHPVVNVDGTAANKINNNPSKISDEFVNGW